MPRNPDQQSQYSAVRSCSPPRWSASIELHHSRESIFSQARSQPRVMRLAAVDLDSGARLTRRMRGDNVSGGARPIAPRFGVQLHDALIPELPCNLCHATGVHIPRHTFCSHLAMRGAAGKAIQELAGHGELSMTSRYMHLSP